MTKRTLEIIAFCIALLIAALAISAWISSRDEQHRLAATLSAQKQVIDAANANERARGASLQSTLAQIDALKRATQTPAQILAALPKYLSLPQPVTLTMNPAAPPQSQPPPVQGTAASANPEPGGSAAPSADASRDPAHSACTPDGSANAECGGLPPLFSPELAPAPKDAPRSGAPCDPSSNDCVAQIPAADLKPLFDYVQNCRACQAELAAAKQNASDDASKIAALSKERDAAVTAAKGGSFLRRLRRNAIWFAVGAAAGYAASKR